MSKYIQEHPKATPLSKPPGPRDTCPAALPPGEQEKGGGSGTSQRRARTLTEVAAIHAAMPREVKEGECTTAGTAGEQTARAKGRESKQKAIKRKGNCRNTCMCVKSLPKELAQHLDLQLGLGG